MADLVPTISLSLDPSGPEAINHVRDLQLTTKLTNRGDHPLTFVSEPTGILSYGLPTEQYIAYTSSGGRPTFKGVLVDFSLEGAIEDGCVVTLAPGQSITVKHDLSGSYEFTDEGQYTFEPRNHFYVVDPTTKQHTLVEAHRSLVSRHSISIRGILVIDTDGAHAKPEAGTAESDDDRFVGMDADQMTQVITAMPLAEQYIESSLIYLLLTSGSTDRYVTWFGTYNDARKEKVKSIFQNITGQIINQKFNAIGDPCKCGCSHKIGTCTHSRKTCPNSENPCHCKNILAYVYRRKPGTIYIMQRWWKAPMVGIKSKPGTLVHELTHFEIYGGTRDHAYGQDNCKKLARDDPNTAVDNADSFRFFAENIPELQ